MEYLWIPLADTNQTGNLTIYEKSHLNVLASCQTEKSKKQNMD